MPRAAPRNTDLAKIHIAKARLGMPDDQYRDLLWTIGRVKSAKDLDWAGRQRLLDHFKACGFAPAAKGGKPSEASEWLFVFRCPPDRQPLLKKIYRLAQAIGALQTPPVPAMPKVWAEGILKQMRGHNAAAYRPSQVDGPLEWAGDADLRMLVQALEIHRKRLEKT